MAAKSILEYEEAKKRLAQLQDDQSAIRELVAKLRQFVERAESELQAIQQRSARSEEALGQIGVKLEKVSATASGVEGQIKTVIAESESVQRDFRRSAKQALDEANASLRDQQAKFRKEANTWLRQERENAKSSLSAFEEKRALLEKQGAAAIDRMTNAADQLEYELKQQLEQWEAQQEKAYDRLADQQHQALSSVTKAYERQKVVYENLKVATESLQSVFDSYVRDNEQQVAAIQQRVDDGAKRLQATSDTLQEAVDSLTHAVGQTRATIESQEQQIEEMDQRFEMAIEEVRKDLDAEMVALAENLKGLAATQDTQTDSLQEAVALLRRRSTRQGRLTLFILFVAVASATVSALYSPWWASIAGPSDPGRADDAEATAVLNSLNGDARTDAPPASGAISRPPSAPRVWTDRKGRMLSASFAGLDGQSVRLRTPGGSVHRVPLENLSDADNAFAKEAAANSSERDQHSEAP